MHCNHPSDDCQASPSDCFVIMTALRRRYRLGVRTEDSQSSNTGSIPVSATKPFAITQYFQLFASNLCPHMPAGLPVSNIAQNETGCAVSVVPNLRGFYEHISHSSR